MFYIFRYINKKEWAMSLGCLVFVVIQVWLDLKLPDYMSSITTLVETPGSDMNEILIQGGYMLACALGSMAASMVTAYMAAKIACGLAKTLRGKVYDQTLGFSLAETNHFSSASLINRTTNDITQIQTLVSMGLQAIIKAPILAVWAIVKISGQSWQWTTATAVAVAVLVVTLAITLVFALPRFQKIQGLTDNLNRVTREQITGIRVVRAYNAQSYEEERFADANDELTDTNLVANRVMALMSPTMTMINSTLTLVVYWIGAYLIQAASLTDRLPIFSNMVVYSNYAMQIIMAFVLLNMVFVLLPRAQVSAKRIREVLETKSSIMDGSGASPTEQGVIEFKNVSFKYPDGKQNVLEDISFTAEPGETVAIIGATGSGKSSLVNLINRGFDVTEGEVLVDGVNVKDYTLEELNDKIGYAPQKATLYSGDVTSNIAFGTRNGKKADDNTVKKAAEIACADEFVDKMDGKMHAAIAQGGTNVSGGQKQRLSVARAVAREPEILVMDDSFSAMDYKTDAKVRHNLKEEAGDTTQIIIAQRIGTIRNADQIIVLDHGKIVGQGTHDELMETCPVYQEIASSQLSRDELQAAA